jgi:hypothetical protein
MRETKMSEVTTTIEVDWLSDQGVEVCLEVTLHYDIIPPRVEPTCWGGGYSPDWEELIGIHVEYNGKTEVLPPPEKGSLWEGVVNHIMDYGINWDRIYRETLR